VPTIKYDVTDVEMRGGGEQAKPGLYAAKIVKVTHRTTDGHNDLEVVFEIQGKKGKGIAQLYTYVGLGEAAAWKLKELLLAVGLRMKGTLNPDKLVGKTLNIKVNADTWNDEYRARVGTMSPLDSEPDDADDDDDGDDDDDDDDDDGDEPDDDYDDQSLADLRKLVKARKLDAKGPKAKLIAALREDDAGDDDDDEPEDDEDEDDYDDWEVSELKEELESRGLSAKGRKAGLIERLRENDAEDEDPFNDDDD
jgi:hypothetical protein